MILWQLIKDLAGQCLVICQGLAGILKIICRLQLIDTTAFGSAFRINPALLRAAQVVHRLRCFCRVLQVEQIGYSDVAASHCLTNRSTQRGIADRPVGLLSNLTGSFYRCPEWTLAVTFHDLRSPGFYATRKAFRHFATIERRDVLTRHLARTVALYLCIDLLTSNRYLFALGCDGVSRHTFRLLAADPQPLEFLRPSLECVGKRLRSGFKAGQLRPKVCNVAHPLGHKGWPNLFDGLAACCLVKVYLIGFKAARKGLPKRNIRVVIKEAPIVDLATRRRLGTDGSGYRWLRV